MGKWWNRKLIIGEKKIVEILEIEVEEGVERVRKNKNMVVVITNNNDIWPYRRDMYDDIKIEEGVFVEEVGESGAGSGGA